MRLLLEAFRVGLWCVICSVLAEQPEWQGQRHAGQPACQGHRKNKVATYMEAPEGIEQRQCHDESGKQRFRQWQAKSQSLARPSLNIGWQRHEYSRRGKQLD